MVTGLATLPIAHWTVRLPSNRQPSLDEDQAKALLGGLLHNVYRSFDHHDEGRIYDRLATSIDGDLLADVYLETRKSMEVKNQGGMRVSVKTVVVTDLSPAGQDKSDPTFGVDGRSAGWIGHWGHIHSRVNQHEAIITVAPRQGRWKITDIDMLDQQTLPSTSGQNVNRQAEVVRAGADV